MIDPPPSANGGAEKRFANSTAAPDPFEPGRLRLSQDFAASVGVKGALLTVPVDSYRIQTPVIEVKLGYEECVQHGCIVPISVRWVDVVMDMDPGGDCTHPVAQERHSIWRNQYRNEQVARIARQFAKDEQVLVTVSSIEHGLWLRQLLPDFTLVYSDGAFSSEEGQSRLCKYLNWGLMGPEEEIVTPYLREQFRKRFESGQLKKVIATSVWERGVDFRRLAVLVRADAKSSMIKNTQIPGRTSRRCDETGKRVGLIYDFRDQFSQKYRRDAYKRRADYMKHGWKQSNETEDSMIQQRFNYEILP